MLTEHPFFFNLFYENTFYYPMKNILLTFFCSGLLCGCATIFSSGTQDITIITPSSKTKVNIDTSFVGIGEILHHTLEKNKELVQITLSQDSCKSERKIIFQNSLSNWYYANFLPPFLLVSYMVAPLDAQPDNTSCYDNEIIIKKPLKKYKYWNKLQKRIGVGDFTFDVKSSDNKWELYSYSDYIDHDKPTRTKSSDSMIGQSDYYESHIGGILRKTGFVDTSGAKIYIDNINNIYLHATISKATVKDIFVRFGTRKTRYFLQNECDVNWSLIDIYGDTLYTAKTQGISGEFRYSESNTREMLDKSFSDAIESSMIDFLNRPIPEKVLSVHNINAANFDPIVINKPNSVPNDLDQSLQAGVTLKDSEKQQHGSGFFISNEGHILTNYHVIAQSKNLKVVLHTGKEVDVQVLRTDKYSDLALLKISQNVPFAYAIPTDKNFKTGGEIMVIGTPKSIELGQSVSKGIVSGIRENPKNSLTYIQTDASINGGNSGGAMIHPSGELIGIIDYKLINGAEGISFAIPAHTVTSLLGLSYKQ